MNRRNLEIDSIYIPEERIRLIDRAAVEMLADDMQKVGQLQPIVVKPEGERFRLIAGEHRLEGVKLLGWTRIECSVTDAEISDEECELIEINENLFRKELTAIERDICLARRKELHLKLYPETGHGGDRKSKRQNVVLTFSKESARAMGLNKRTIERSVTRVNALDLDVREALKTSPIGRNASEIERLSKLWRNLDDDQQKKLLGAITRGAKTLLNALKAVGLAPAPGDPTQMHQGKLESAWARAPKAAREAFLDAVAPGWRKLKIDVGAGAPEADAAANDDAGVAA